MKVGDLVRYLPSWSYDDHLSEEVYIVEEIIDHGVDGRGGTCFLLGYNEPDAHGRRMKFFQCHLEVINESR